MGSRGGDGGGDGEVGGAQAGVLMQGVRCGVVMVLSLRLGLTHSSGKRFSCLGHPSTR